MTVTEPLSPVETTTQSIANTVEEVSTTQTTLTTDETPRKDELTRQLEDLTRQLTETTQKAENYWDTLLRKQADYENLQKRTTRDLENTRKYAIEKFATELLTVKDSLEMGLDAANKLATNPDTVREGIALTLKILADTLTKFGIGEINPLAQKFDPQWHEAMAMQQVPQVEEGTVIHVHQKGYQLHDRLLRPARVVVAKAMPAEKPLEN